MLSHPGHKSLTVVVAAIAIGIAYFAYISAVDYPPDLLRVAPWIWLAGAVAGLILSWRAGMGRSRSRLAQVGIILSVPSVLLALIFATAAIMGD